MPDDDAEVFEERPGILSGLGEVAWDAPEKEHRKKVHEAEEKLDRVYRERLRVAGTRKGV